MHLMQGFNTKSGLIRVRNCDTVIRVVPQSGQSEIRCVRGILLWFICKELFPSFMVSGEGSGFVVPRPTAPEELAGVARG